MEVITRRKQPDPVRHINKVTIQGVVITTPVLKSLKSGTQSIVFKIRSNETFISGNRVVAHTNEFVIEALGGVVRKVQDLVIKNGTYVFDGYLRSDVFDRSKKLKRIRVRIFHVEKY